VILQLDVISSSNTAHEPWLNPLVVRKHDKRHKQHSVVLGGFRLPHDWRTESRNAKTKYSQIPDFEIKK
jgi:hypothetical protein